MITASVFLDSLSATLLQTWYASLNYQGKLSSPFRAPQGLYIPLELCLTSGQSTQDSIQAVNITSSTIIFDHVT